MIELLILLFLNSLLIIGFNRATEYDESNYVIESKNILWFVRYYLIKTIGPFYTKPICSCVGCMASLHSIAPFWLYATSHNIEHAPIIYPFYIMALSGASILINSLIQD